MKKERTRRSKLPRKSTLRGRLARLQLRQEQAPKDHDGVHYIFPGSMKK